MVSLPALLRMMETRSEDRETPGMDALTRTSTSIEATFDG